MSKRSQIKGMHAVRAMNAAAIRMGLMRWFVRIYPDKSEHLFLRLYKQ